MATLAIAGVALILIWHPARVAVQTLVLLPRLFPEGPLDVLGLVTARPTRDERQFTYTGGTVTADVYHPRGTPGARYGGVVFTLGAFPLPRRDPLVERFAESLARTGVVVVVPESPNLLAGRVVPEEIEALVGSVDLVAAQSDVATERIGLIGLSVGGGLSVTAAADERLRNRVAFVNTLGGYFDVEGLVVDAASRSVEVDGEPRPWQPDERTLRVLAIALLNTLPPGEERSRLWARYVEASDAGDPGAESLTPPATDILRLLDGTTREEARAIIARLPPVARARFQAVSPAGHIQDLRARLYVMHDTGDTLIPFTESRRLAAAVAPGTLLRQTEFSIFQHVVPDRPVPWQTFLPDVWALFWHLQAVMLELL